MDLDGYADRYPNATLERRDGILEMTLHDGQGGPLKWSGSAHADLSLLFRDIAVDRKSTRLNSSHSAKSRMPSSA